MSDTNQGWLWTTPGNISWWWLLLQTDAASQQMCSFLCWRIKALASCWEGETESKPCMSPSSCKGSRMHTSNCKALPQQWLCHHRGWCADIIRFQSFCNTMQCQCSDGTGREPVGEVDPIGLVWIPVRKRKLFLRLFEVKALRRTEISSLWQSYGKCFHFYIHLLHIPAFTLQASLDSPV